MKYFSGTATYTRTVQVDVDCFVRAQRILLNLGTVNDLAEVSVNGKRIVILWKPPYRADITAALVPGRNHLEIMVTNQWTNRLAGDRAVPPEKRILSAGRGGAGPTGATNQALPASGLLGPVALIKRISEPQRTEKH